MSRKTFYLSLWRWSGETFYQKLLTRLNKSPALEGDTRGIINLGESVRISSPNFYRLINAVEAAQAVSRDGRNSGAFLPRRGVGSQDRDRGEEKDSGKPPGARFISESYSPSRAHSLTTSPLRNVRDSWWQGGSTSFAPTPNLCVLSIWTENQQLFKKYTNLFPFIYYE